jgi:hypothetical protein
MPTDAAAFGFSPTARIRRPSGVLYRNMKMTATDRNAT